MTSRDQLPSLLEEAAAAHGHLCPSLVYGVRLALILAGRIPPGTIPDSLEIHHTSSCLRDGALAALRRLLPSAPTPASRVERGACRVAASWKGGGLTLAVPAGVRRGVDALKERHPDLQTFRAEGVRLLLALPDEEFAESG